MWNRKGFYWCPNPDKGHTSRAKDISAFVKWRSVERIVLHWASSVLAFDTDQKRFFFCPGHEQDSIVEVEDTEQPRIRLLTTNILNNFWYIGASNENHFHLNKKIIRLRAITRQEVGWIHVLDNMHQLAAKKAKPCFSLTVALKFMTKITVASGEECRRAMLVTLFARILNLGAFVLAIEQLSCRVTHHTNRKVSTQAISFTIWRSFRA